MICGIFAYTYAIFVDFPRERTSRTQKLVRIPLLDSILLNILEVLKLKFSKIDKRGVLIRSEGWEIFQKFISRGGGGRLLSTKEYTCY